MAQAEPGSHGCHFPLISFFADCPSRAAVAAQQGIAAAPIFNRLMQEEFAADAYLTAKRSLTPGTSNCSETTCWPVGKPSTWGWVGQRSSNACGAWKSSWALHSAT
jgi:hypothetical protein